MATEKDLLISKIFLRAVLPVTKVLIEDDPVMKKRFSGVNAKIQFQAKNNSDFIGTHLIITNGELSISPEVIPDADIVFSFSSVEKMNDFFKGKLVLPSIKGLFKIGLLIKAFSLLLGTKILMPDARPKDDAKKKLKVKMAFYMITTALSQYNKAGDSEMVKWTKNQPERIYQITVEPGDIAAYLKVKAGKTKAGKGVYKKRRPFVHLKFNGINGAFPVIMNDVDMVEAVKRGYLEMSGSPEYGSGLGNFMKRIQELIT
ncbi:MAG: hypothetical protein HQK76_02630 [Desulfobacterales bacterium]|nr:hypothetical protein [Desulfobacterales bacterium]